MADGPTGWSDPTTITELAIFDAAALALMEHALAVLPSPQALCPFCVVLAALPFPEFARTRLCAEHLPVARALQCRGWNAERWHQHLAALARWGKLPRSKVEWWPQPDGGTAREADPGATREEQEREGDTELPAT